MKTDLFTQEKILHVLKELEQNLALTRRKLIRKTRGSGAIYRAYRIIIIDGAEGIVDLSC